MNKDEKQVLPVRVLAVWRQAGEQSLWVAEVSNGLKIGARGDDAIEAFRNATRWVKENVNE